jgi:hypothetical protein
MSDESVDRGQTERARRLAELRDQTERDYPESWIPTEGEPAIAGEYVRLDHGYNSYGPQDIVVLRTEDGRERGVWLVHLVLREQINRLEPKPGELLCVRWKGKREGASGNEYDHYRVAIDRETKSDKPDLDDGRSFEFLPETAREREDLPF